MAASKEPRLPRTFPNHTEQTSIVLSACACRGPRCAPAMLKLGRPFKNLPKG